MGRGMGKKSWTLTKPIPVGRVGRCGPLTHQEAINAQKKKQSPQGQHALLPPSHLVALTLLTCEL